MNKTEIIKSFVINKLGCNCPAEVFQVIKWQQDVKVNDQIILNYKINIGNRLLIYIIEIEDTMFLNEYLLKIIAMGIAERNENKFNRFRLVITGNNVAAIGSVAQVAFNNLNIEDQKVHLHVLQKAETPL